MFLRRSSRDKPPRLKTFIDPTFHTAVHTLVLTARGTARVLYVPNQAYHAFRAVSSLTRVLSGRRVPLLGSRQDRRAAFFSRGSFCASVRPFARSSGRRLCVRQRPDRFVGKERFPWRGRPRGRDRRVRKGGERLKDGDWIEISIRCRAGVPTMVRDRRFSVGRVFWKWWWDEISYWLFSSLALYETARLGGEEFGTSAVRSDGCSEL